MSAWLHPCIAAGRMPLRLGWSVAVCIAVGAVAPTLVLAQGPAARPFAEAGNVHWAFQKLKRPIVPRAQALALAVMRLA